MAPGRLLLSSPCPSTGLNPLARLAQDEEADAPAVKREAEEDWGRDKWR